MVGGWTLCTLLMVDGGWIDETEESYRQGRIRSKSVFNAFKLMVDGGWMDGHYASGQWWMVDGGWMNIFVPSFYTGTF